MGEEGGGLAFLEGVLNEGCGGADGVFVGGVASEASKLGAIQIEEDECLSWLASVMLFNEQAISVGGAGPMDEAGGVSGAILSEAVEVEALSGVGDAEFPEREAARAGIALGDKLFEVFGGGKNEEGGCDGVESELEGREDAEGVGGDHASRADLVLSSLVEADSLIAHGGGGSGPHEHRS